MGVNITKRFFRVLSGFFLMACFLGCGEFGDMPDLPVGEDMSLTLKVRMPGKGSQSTRTLTSEQENRMETVKVLVFKEEVGSGETYSYTAPIQAFTPGGTEVTVKLIRSLPGEKYRLVLLANLGDIAGVPVKGESKEKTLQRYRMDCDTVWNTKTELIPMWGETNKAIVINEDAKLGTVSLLRALARVDIGLGFDNTESEDVTGIAGFKLNSVSVYRSNNTGYVAPAAANINTDNTVTVPSIPGDVAQNGQLPYTLTEDDKAANKYVREIYLPEALAGDKTTNPCLVIGGYYGAANTTDVTYYRIDFLANGKRLPLLRNHRYKVNITRVSGPGFDTEEEALNADPFNITAVVKEWNENELTNVDYDGQNFFKTETKEVVLLSAAGSTKTIAVSSDVPVAEWKMSFDNGVTSTVEEILTSTKYKVEKSADKLVFTALKGYDANPAPNQETLLIRVKSLEIFIKVSQVNATDHGGIGSVTKPDWENGNPGVDPDVEINK